MRIFVTGATGFIGSAIVPELLDAGHDVVGLARSEQAAAALARAGAAVHRGSLQDLDSLRSGAAAADGVIHCAFVHDFSQMENSGRIDRHAIEAIGDALAGSGRPLVVTSGTGLIAPGRPATEADLPEARGAASHRAASERTTLALAERGVRASLMRLPASVHGAGDHGFVPFLIDIARNRGASGYIGDGANRWPAVHRLDAARLFRLAVEDAPAGSVLHGVAEEGIPTRAIADVIGRHLELPVVSIASDEAAEHFGWLGAIFGADIPATSALTRERTGWEPVRPGLIDDVDAGHYFQAQSAAA
jgi:nucleoside-diphosphate-sugar epimerase